jgi:CBS domain-containing protein
MQGIELSRRFYVDIVRPWLIQVAPELRHAAALIGYGSELLGFDDETSRDHNWGPRVHIYVTEEDFAQHARRLLPEFTKVMPESYLGEPIGWRSRPHPAADGAGAVGAFEHGLEFHTLQSRLHSHFALRSLDELGPMQWLGLAEQKLLAFTAGAVFHDDDGRLTRAREALAYFPDDVWFYRIACQWRRIAEEQAFVGRAGQVGDDLGSRVIAARLVRDVMRMGFLLDRRYAPYPKWFGRGFAALPIAADLTPHLEQAVRADHWTERGEALAAAYLVLARRQQAMDVAPFTPVVGLYHERPFTTINADAAVDAAHAAIVDPQIRQLPVMGALDQVSDLTPLLEDAPSSRDVMQALLG